MANDLLSSLIGGGMLYAGGKLHARVPVTTVSASGAAQALSAAANGDTAYDVTLTANCALSLAGGTAGQLQRVYVQLRQDGTGGRTPSFPANVKYPGGTAPSFSSTAAGAVLFVAFTTLDGGVTWLGLAG